MNLEDLRATRKGKLFLWVSSTWLARVDWGQRAIMRLFFGKERR